MKSLLQLYHGCAICLRDLPRSKTRPRKYCSLRCAKKSFRERNKEKIKAYWKFYYKNNKFRLRKNAWRFEILNRDNFTCQYCGKKAPSVELEIDHKLPKSKGGKNQSSNYLTTCIKCNRGKSNNLIS